MNRDLRDYFFSLAEAFPQLLTGDEIATAYLRGEDSTFVRFNHGRIGQAGDVHQLQIDVDLIRGRRHALGQLRLSGDRDADWARLRAMAERLREIAVASPEDPYLAFNTDPAASGESAHVAALPPPGEVLDAVATAAGDADLVGVYAAGGIHRGFASSLGQRNWHATHSFNLDWSVFGGRDGGAVKAAYAGFEWSAAALRQRIAAAIADLELLGAPPRAVAPGKYRVYLAPAALHELFSLLAWGGFGARARMTRVSPLLRLYENRAALAPSVDVDDDIAGGAAPPFDGAGFPRPGRVPLVAGGRAAACLVSPRSAREYGVDSNAAEEDEAPLALEVGGGELDAERIAAELHRGLLISNLWYLNFSDRPACRITGMTRFATLWVENGRAAAPVEPMRFDDSVYRMLGDHLVGLTRQREWIMDPGSYEWRSTRTALLPGVLVDDFTLTL